MERVYNFSAGPSMLPLEVLEEAKNELTIYKDTGMSVMEMSHRTKMFMDIYNEAVNNLKILMSIPDNYKVLFMQGGASLQFACVPLNLMKNGKADYIISGNFSNKAALEAQKYGEIRILANSKEDNYSYVPYVNKFNEDSDYVHICFNNTIFGTQYNYIPDTKEIPLVADVSSCILSRPIDVSKFGVLYAGAQKNIAPAGLTIVIVREDLLGNIKPYAPIMCDWKVQADNDSMYNTPPCYDIYIANLVFKWLLKKGGLKEMEKINNEKAKMLYDYLDNSKLFKGTAKKESRSIMNVCFNTGNADIDKAFIEEASKNGLVNLKGHKVAGGMRASIYNAMPIEGVKKLVSFMKEFEEKNYV